MTLFRVTNLRISMIFIFATLEACTSELRLLQSVFRHGDRYPLAFSTTKLFFPLNPNANATWFPDSTGSLTMEGKRRSHELGNVLRERYGDWLGRSYSKKTIEFRSNGNERSTITTSLVAAGLFPPNNGSQMWNPSLNWQPIPISSIRYPENILFYGCIFCTKWVALLAKTKLEDHEIIEYDASMKEVYDYVSTNIGAPADNRILYYLYMELLAAVSGGLTPPTWTKGMFPDGIFKEAAIMEYKYSSWNDELKRLTGGIWLKRWLDHVDDWMNKVVSINLLKTENSKGRKKAFFYGGHDINVAGIMTTLGIFYPHVPNYASAINLELHEDDEQRFYVKVVHRDSGDFIEYLIPGCGNILCPLDTFRNLFASILTFNATDECNGFGMIEDPRLDTSI